MNAAVRAVVRMGIYLGCKVYFIKEGYQGKFSKIIEYSFGYYIALHLQEWLMVVLILWKQIGLPLVV